MLLNRGTIDGRQVLSPAAFANLTDFDHYRFHPGMPGGGYSFIQFEEFRGLEYAHSGHMPGFSSMMTLYPDADVGIFVSFLGGQVGTYNMTFTAAIKALRDTDVQPGARDGLSTLDQLTDAIVAKFIPADRPRTAQGGVEMLGLKDSQPGIDAFLGSYVLTTAHSRSYAARVFGWGSTIKVERAGADSIRFSARGLGEFRQVGSLLYENEKKQRVAFAELDTGRYMAIGLSGGMFRKTNALETPNWALPLLALCLLVMLTASPLGCRRSSAVSTRFGWCRSCCRSPGS